MSKKRKAPTCYNCQTPLTQSENFCPTCGQENHSRQASTRMLISDFLNDYLTFDSKLFKSIIPLLTKPGFITKEYLDGKRQQFIPPIRVFLFLSFVYFGLSFLIGEKNGAVNFSFDDTDGDIAQQVGESFNKYFDLAVFCFTPILAWIIMLFYRSKERKYYVNFFVYSLHFLSFLFILGSILMLLTSGLSWVASPETVENIWAISAFLAFIYICIYAVTSLKRVFNKKRNILRFIIVMLLAIAVFVIVLLLYLFLIAVIKNGWSADFL